MANAQPREDDDSDSFEMTYVLEEVGDGAVRVIRTIETYRDGSTVQTEYVEDLPADDPFVLTRQRAGADEPAREILTTFVASAIRPKTYPAGFPFLAGRSSSTTESPARVTSPGVTWRCDDPEVVLAALVGLCLADSWAEVPLSSVAPFVEEHSAVAFRRDKDVRIFYRVDHEQGSLIRMMDLPGDWLAP